MFGDVSIHQTVTVPVLLFPALSIFIAAESRARLESGGGFHCASLMLDRVIGSAVKDGYTRVHGEVPGGQANSLSCPDAGLEGMRAENWRHDFGQIRSLTHNW